MNGESGAVMDINADEECLTVLVDDKEVVYPIRDADQLTLAAAMTVHKSQGSQFPAVVIPVTTQHYMMLTRSVIYTAITRASKFCVLIGERRALDMAIKNARLEPRLTQLLHRLRGR
jgi:exodeoxyribonuclease V alpha subunit